ncbi:MAG: inositol monophosphatase family protein, partial [Gammaproteobacteria bacterium]
ADLVSEVDRDTETMLIEALHKAYPDHSITGEEHGKAIEGSSDYTWVIDPLDGNTNYLQGIPHYAISIAAMRGRHIEHAVIVDPLKNDEFVASRGHGAQLNGKRIRVTTTPRLTDALINTGIPPASVDAHLERYLAQLKYFMANCRALRRFGAAALDLAYVAAGRSDGFWEIGLKPWDIAAGALLVREAGGFVGDLEGGDRFLASGDVVAANPKLFKLMVQAIRATA